MTASILNAISAEGRNIVLQVSAADLKQIVGEMYHAEKSRTEEAIKQHRERATLSRKEACRVLGVSQATLWHWAKDGYLVPVKIGSKVMYKASDIDRILTENQKTANS